jgi:hypothetical protein
VFLLHLLWRSYTFAVVIERQRHKKARALSSTGLLD